MPIRIEVRDYGDELTVYRIHPEGVTSVLFSQVPSGANAALSYLAELATSLLCENAELQAETAILRRELLVLEKARQLISRGLDLFAWNDELRAEIAALRETVRGHYGAVPDA